MRLHPSAIICLTLSFAMGCGDDGTGASPPVGGGDTGGGGGSVPTCEDLGGQCLDIPEGFEGPIELHDGGVANCTNPAFEGGYDGDPFDAPEAACGCACGPASPCTYDATAHDTETCVAGATSMFTDLPPAACNVVEAAGADVLGVVLGPSDEPSACSSNDAAAVLPAIAFDPRVDGCNVNLELCDGGGTCVPDSVLTYCIFSESESTCPAGFGVEHRIVREEDFEDTRNCACACSGNADCEAEATLFGDDACTVALGTAEPGPLCNTGRAGEAIAAVSFAEPPGCSAAVENVTGDVTLIGQGVLVCCVGG